MAKLFLGIDGGGSKCRARIRDEGGAKRGEAEGGIANIYFDFDAALAAIVDTARAAAAEAGANIGELHAGLGLAGAMTSDAVARVRSAHLPFAPLVFAAARDDDPHGLAIVEEAAQAAALMARKLIADGARRLSLIGGISHSLKPYLAQDVAALLVEPKADPVDGAIMMARHD